MTLYTSPIDVGAFHTVLRGDTVLLNNPPEGALTGSGEAGLVIDGSVICKGFAVKHTGYISMTVGPTSLVSGEISATQIFLQNFGSINGSISTNIQSYINNFGSINGTIRFGGGFDIFRNAGGFVSGKVFGGGGNDSLTGGDGADDLNGGVDNDTLVGGAGDDTLDGGSGIDEMRGGTGNDRYYLDSADDQIVEEANGGRDTVVATFSHVLDHDLEDLILEFAAPSAISATGNAARNLLRGNELANTLNGAAGADTLQGLDGNDAYVVDDALDRVIETAGGGVDRTVAYVSHALAANVEALVLVGTALAGTGNSLANAIVGNALGNTLNGVAGNDTISAGDGNDILAGGLGTDRLAGGTGKDNFLFDSAPATAGNADIISDFLPVDDTIRLENAVFTGLPVIGTLAAAAFRIGAGVTVVGDASDRIIYDTATGRIFYDADGIGGTASVLVATLTTKPVLTSADFLVV